MVNIELLAQAAHEMNRIFCLAIGDNTQVHWEDAPEWQKTSARNGAQGMIDGNSPDESHRSWLKEKVANGWSYGPVKDPDKKEHPCMVPYVDLPMEQQLKDDIFVSTVILFDEILFVLTESKNNDISME